MFIEFSFDMKDVVADGFDVNGRRRIILKTRPIAKACHVRTIDGVPDTAAEDLDRRRSLCAYVLVPGWKGGLKLE